MRDHICRKPYWRETCWLETMMKEIGIGVIGTGFMGKAHSIAYSASASVFGTACGHAWRSSVTSAPTARRKGNGPRLQPLHRRLARGCQRSCRRTDLRLHPQRYPCGNFHRRPRSRQACMVRETDVDIAWRLAGHDSLPPMPTRARPSSATTTRKILPSPTLAASSNPAPSDVLRLSSAAMTSTMKPTNRARGHGACRARSREPAPMATS